MANKLIKLSIATAIIAGVVGSSFSTKAYPPFLRKAQKFGAKDCRFCHTEPTGGEGWNERGQWLIAEKERRKADAKPTSNSARSQSGLVYMFSRFGPTAVQPPATMQQCSQSKNG